MISVHNCAGGSTGSSVGTGTNNSLTLPSVTSVMANDDRGGNDENGNIRTKREVQTGCNGVIWCQGDGNWGTPVRCLPISSTGELIPL